VADPTINVHEALSIGESMAFTFKTDLPDAFYKPVKKQVVTMETMKKRCQDWRKARLHAVQRSFAQSLNNQTSQLKLLESRQT
jgi:hypothetical protein